MPSIVSHLSLTTEAVPSFACISVYKSINLPVLEMFFVYNILGSHIPPILVYSYTITWIKKGKKAQLPCRPSRGQQMLEQK